MRRRVKTYVPARKEKHSHPGAAGMLSESEPTGPPPKYWCFSGTEPRFSRTARIYTPSSSGFCWADKKCFPYAAIVFFDPWNNF